MSTRDSFIFDAYDEEASLIELWKERQAEILAVIPKYGRRVVYAAIIGFTLTVVIQSVSQVLSYVSIDGLFDIEPSLFEVSKSLLKEILAGFEFKSFSLGGLITFVLSVFSNIVMWAFVIWSLTFIPFIAYHSYRIAQSSKANSATRPFKWIQLYSSTLLPMAVFAIAWNSTPERQGGIVIQVNSLGEIVILIVSTIVVTAILFGVTRLVPSSAIAIRLSLFSFLIYSTLYFAYGQGYSIVSFSLLLGVMFYLMFASDQIEAMGRGLVTYDLDDSIIQRLNSLDIRNNELQLIQDETVLAEHENNIVQVEAKARSQLDQSQIDQKLNRQLSEIQSKKLELVQKMNRTQIHMLEKRIDMLNKMFDVTSREFSNRLNQEFPKKLDELKEEAQSLSPQELQSRMNELMLQMNPVLEGIPESLGDLRNQLLDAANQLEEQTRLLIADSRITNDEENG